MVSFKTTSALGLLLLAFLASLSDAKDSALLSASAFEDSVVFEQEFRLLENATDDEIDDHEDEDHDHEDEDGQDELIEDEHDELTEAERLALETKCTCMEGKLFCSDAEGLEHCHCEGGEAHCDGDEGQDGHDHEHEERDHEEHDDHDEHDEHDDHGHDDHDDHGDEEHGHGHAHSEYDDHSDEAKPWGTVIGMCLVVNLTTLVGVFLIAGHWSRNLFCKNWKPSAATGNLWVNVIIPMFACGTLLATTFFLLLPEALHMIEAEFGGGHDHRRLAGDQDDHDDHGDEAATTWRWGTSIMGGFLFPVFLHAFFPHQDNHGHTHAPLVAAKAVQAEGPETAVAVPAGNVEKSSAEKPANDEKKSRRFSSRVSARLKNTDEGYVTVCGCFSLKNVPLFVSMNLGEALHNLTDGIFIGAAYIGCGPALAKSVVLASVLHELPNQLAGYMVMVNQNGIDPVVALFINFLFGLSMLIGGLIVLVLDLGRLAIASIFAIAGGLFLHVAIAEMLKTAETNVHGVRQVAYMLFSFVFGSILIGLVLLDHEHCGEF